MAATSLGFEFSVFEIPTARSLGGCVEVVRNMLTLADTLDDPEAPRMISGVPSAIAHVLSSSPVRTQARTVVGGEVFTLRGGELYIGGAALARGYLGRRTGSSARRALPAPQYAGAGAGPRPLPGSRRCARCSPQVLGLDQVGVEDSFFGLDGHSCMSNSTVRAIGEYPDRQKLAGTEPPPAETVS